MYLILIPKASENIKMSENKSFRLLGYFPE